MFSFLLIFCLAFGPTMEAVSSAITFPTSFTSLESAKIDRLEVKKCYQKGIDAVLSVAGLVQNLLLEETINFATKNWVISPLSLASLFAQILMGSRGEIQKTLTHALSLVDEGDYNRLDVHRQLGNLLRYLQHTKHDDYILLYNSVLFLQNEFPLKATYRHAIMDFYNTKIIPVDFTEKSLNSLKKISQWVRDSTLGKFSNLLPSVPPPSTVSLMANVVYFKGAWELPFDPEYTQPGDFFIDQNRKIRVDYMYGEQEVLYGNTSDFQLIGLPFKSREVVIYILLPNGKFSTRMAMKQLDAMASSARLENVTLIMPKFKITTMFSVKGAIAKYLRKKEVLSQRFSGRMNYVENDPLSKSNPFDMGGASDDVRFKIDDIIHKVAVQIDEKGTEIVALTSTLVDHSASDFVLRVNRPFLFFVRHELTLTHLFWGLVVSPNKAT